MECLPTSKVNLTFIMQNDVILCVNSKIGAVFIFLDLEDSLIIVDLIDIKDVEELVSHID